MDLQNSKIAIRRAGAADCAVIYRLICALENETLPQARFEAVFARQLAEADRYVCLLGEQGGDRPGQAVVPAAESGYDDGFAVPLNLPGDSARSARIEQTVSAWSTPEPTMPAVRPDLAQPAAPAPADNAATPQPEPTVSPAQTPAADPSQSDADAADATAAPTPAQPAAKPKRRSGRSAVPSWDEILFGD